MDENGLVNVPILGNLCKNWDNAIKFIEKYTNLTKEGAEALSVVLLGVSLYEMIQLLALLVS